MLKRLMRESCSREFKEDEPIVSVIKSENEEKGNEEMELRELDPIVRERIAFSDPDDNVTTFRTDRLLFPIISDSVSVNEEDPN